jgi:8-amino-7-oxononanoate synthase
MLACAVLAALEVIRQGEPRRAHLARLVERFRQGAARLPWASTASTTPIQPLIVGDNAASVALSRRLRERGILVPAIRPPTVPAGTARLRVSLSAAHAEGDIDTLLSALRECA